ncbi:hypothetical protein ESA94_05620 [Lacibacter luteus]|uniref:SD-repeat containing protein B domain-containing protein n=1 Tax=Lacibacter luteus TaxID=2508719 RepID=A0A4Q1CN42_9BACT|nr:SdrD B-like domain-containing protein [Lacibacter luteus]RXK62480.1 hypothetical protein ESA94_05620 [Lacibacter luteus]
MKQFLPYKRNCMGAAIKNLHLLFTLSIALFVSTNVANAQCTCTGNIVVNPSFESGTTGWSWSGGSFNAGTGAIACGSKSGDFQISNTSSNWVSQTIGTDLAPGTKINASVYAGTHNNSYYHQVAIDFFDANWNWISNSKVEVNKVLSTSPVGPQLYTWSGTVPVGTKYTNVSFSGNGDWIKTDQWCVTLTPPAGGSIGDRVWLDADGDGLQDASETSGIAGVTVQLKNSLGSVIATTTTNASGNYLFTGLAAGNYTVVFPTSISGAVVTPQNVGLDDNVDSDASQTTGATSTITLATNQNITNVDAGYCPTTLSLGNRVWYDTNNDGINSNENGIPNLTVYLYKDDNNDNVADAAAIATAVTDANGYYMFSNLAPGNYIVGAVTPAGYMSSLVNGGDPDDNNNSDDNGEVTVGAETRGLAITLVAGTEPLVDGNTNSNSNITYDFGFLPDCNCTSSSSNLLINGSFENGTTGWSASGGSVSSGTGYVACGAANGFNSWSSGTSRVWQDVAVAAGSTVVFKGFAGVHTAGLTCSPKLSLIFYNSSNTVISQNDVVVTRDVDKYFGQLEQYSITAVAPAGTVKVRVQSAITCNYMKLDALCLTATAPLALGDRVFFDLNDNGTRDGSETGLAGVTVKLYADNNNDNIADGAALQTTTTDANGFYRFSNLTAGNYIVGVVVPAGYRSSTLTGVDPDNNVDLDDNGNNTLISGEIRGNAVTLSAGSEPQESGNFNNTYDFGFTGTGSIGDFVWNDLNANGIQDAGEPGLSGVTVTLTYPGGTTVTATTDANGAYQFNNLPPGTYSISFSTPSGYIAGSANQGADDAKDSDPVSGTVSGIVLTAGQNNTTIDAGFVNNQLVLGNFVWYDKDNDGVQDAGEPGIAGVTVNLYKDANGDNIADGAAVATTTTNASGLYSFTGLTAGNYIVGVVLPSGYAASAVSSATPNNDVNTDNNGVTTASGEVRSNYITLSTAGEPTTDGDDANGNLTLDFGLRGTASIGDYVWNDLNGNGIQNTGEPGLSGVTVTLTYPDGTTVTTTTDGSGAYLFANLAPGTYSVAFATPNGSIASPSNAGADDTKDSDPVSGVVSGITLTAGQTNTTIDAGFQSNGLNLGNFVWYDRNNNGVQDAGEPGIAGATVKLYADANLDNIADGAALQTTTTDANGIYSFTGLTPGNYIAGVVLPAGYAASSVSSSTPNNDVNTDNNGVTTTSGEVRSNYITLITASEPTTDGDGSNGNLTLDFGLKGTGSIGDFVWNDLNGDGIQNAGEPGLSAVTVTLTYPGGATATTTTDANGAYQFTNLAPGTYSVSFTTPSGYIAAPANQGADDAKDSDPVSGTVAGIVLTAGQTNTTIDAGFVSNQLTLGNFVWYDKDNDGVQDAGELGIAAVTVNLYKDANGDNVADGAAVATTTTNASGIYNFSGLTPGNYIAGVVLPAGYAPSSVSSTTPNNDINTDNNGVTTAAGEVRSNYITLTTAGEPTTDGDGSNGNLTLDFGLRGTASIGDFVWNDLNGDGIQTAGEPGIAGVTVTLTTAGGTVLETTTTNASGFYQFSNLLPGTYNVVFATPTGFVASAANAGADDTKDSDPVSGTVTGVVLNADENDNTVDAGFQSNQLKVGNYVWYDKNNNGFQDADETGIAGVSVKLYVDADANNIPDAAAIASTTTDANGLYSFSGLTPGNYIVGITAPSGYAMAFTTLSSLLPNNDNNTDNNGITIIGTEITSNYITLITNSEPVTDGDGNNGNLTLDFGLKGTGSIGDLVWDDLNANGKQDAGEPGIAGVTVTLTYPGGSTTSVITDATGTYLFSNLAPGSYSVSFDKPLGYIETTANQVADDTKDSDVISGSVSNVTLTAGQTNFTVDAGYYKPASIGDFVWNDLNANGIQDAGEPGIAGATVNLTGTDATGAAVNLTVSTEADGSYSFSSLLPGTYNVSFVTPAGYVTATSNAGADDTKDSDPVSGAVNGITLISGQNNATVDAGFIQQTPIVLSGHVFYDDNGMSDGFVNGTSVIPSGINAVLYDPLTNTVVAVQPVPGYGQPGAGTFSFNVLTYSTYRVLITTANPAVGSQAPVTSVLPASFRSTGETIGTAAGNDGTIDGKSSIINTTNQNIIEVNFAIKRVVLIVVD